MWGKEISPSQEITVNKHSKKPPPKRDNYYRDDLLNLRADFKLKQPHLTGGRG
jgi:hypothetical protein